MMTVLDKIKSFFKRGKPPKAPREKLGKTTKPYKKPPKATRKKLRRPSKRKSAG
jgi:hypothetical protein